MGYHPSSVPTKQEPIDLEYEPRAAFLPFHERVQRWAVNVCTGAASGIGEAGARRFAEEGARVVGADLAEIPGRDPETPAPLGRASQHPRPRPATNLSPTADLPPTRTSLTTTMTALHVRAAKGSSYDFPQSYRRKRLATSEL
jgi:hypothetical protein